MRNVYTVGDTLLDIIFKNDKPVDAKAGGSLLNSAVSLGRLGASVAMIGATANDAAGSVIRNFLSKNNVKTDFITLCNNDKSNIALAFLDEENNAEYSFYKVNKKASEVNFPKIIKENDIVLFGSSYALREEVRENLVDFLRYAKSQKAVIIYDPNCRAANKHKLSLILPYIKENMNMASIVKGSNEDFENICNLNSSDKVSDWMKSFTDAHLIYTAGKNDVKLHTNNYTANFKVPKIKAVSTVGAGDTFNSAIAYSLLKENILHNQLNNLPSGFWDKLVITAIFFSQQVCMGYENYISENLANEYLL